jgi:hypothetical protein
MDNPEGPISIGGTALAIQSLPSNTKNQHDKEYEAESAAAVIAVPVERAAPEPAKAPEQRDYQKDEEDGSE